jgi:hypothetical protein
MSLEPGWYSHDLLGGFQWDYDGICMVFHWERMGLLWEILMGL